MEVIPAGHIGRIIGTLMATNDGMICRVPSHDGAPKDVRVVVWGGGGRNDCRVLLVLLCYNNAAAAAAAAAS